MQMQFNLPEINRELTKKKVESTLEKYRMFLLMEPDDLQPKITTSFTITPPTMNNQFHSNTESVAVERLEYDKKRTHFLEWVQRAVNRLSYQERVIIIKRYLTHEDIYDYEVYNEMGFSERKYYRIKSRAFYKLAFIMKLEVYKEDEKRIIC